MTKEIKRFINALEYEPTCIDCEYYRGIARARLSDGTIVVNQLADAYCTKIKGLVADCLTPACKAFSTYDKEAVGD